MDVTLWYYFMGSHFYSHATLDLFGTYTFWSIKVCYRLPRLYVNLILESVLRGALGSFDNFVHLVIWKPGRNQCEVIAAVVHLDSAHRL